MPLSGSEPRASAAPRNIFLVRTDVKEWACLAPLLPEFAAMGVVARPVALPQDASVLRATQNPVFVIASRETAALLGHTRGRDGMFLAYLNHGVAPFKRVSYDRHFCDYDLLLASTELIRARLARLYPSCATRFLLGGFPRLEMLASMMRERARHVAAISGLYFAPDWAGARAAVVFSWGLRPATIAALPDRPGIVYLFHPTAVDGELAGRRWRHALPLRSTPEIVADLLATADVVVGDLSSLTLEAIALGRAVHLLLDIGIYVEGYDLDGEFLNPSSPNYLRVPETDARLDGRACLRFADLCRLLEAENRADAFARSAILDRAKLPPGMLPPEGPGATRRCAEAILLTAGVPRHQTAFAAAPPRQVDALEDLIGLCYRLALNRDPDPSGLENYRARYATSPLRDGKDRARLVTLLLAELHASKEARARQRDRSSQSPLMRYLDWRAACVQEQPT